LGVEAVLSLTENSKPQARDLVRLASDAAWERNATDPVAIDVSGRLPLTDAFLILTGSSERNVLAIADAVDERMSAQGVPLKRREGRGQGRWELLDFGDVVVHVFHRDERGHYDLEGLWADAPRIEVSP
jgi:ribosome-associated protein